MAVALVTGCSSGNGLATAVALARAGHTVAATMRRLDRGADIKKIADGEKLPIYLAAVDVNDDESVRSGFAKVVRDLGPIDALVNNAGIPGGMAVEETSLETFRSVMETNFFGALRCIKAVVPAMRERRSGIIVNITSISGRIPVELRRVQVGSRGAERIACAGNATLPRARRHCRARGDRDLDFRQGGAAFGETLPIPEAHSRLDRGCARKAGASAAHESRPSPYALAVRAFPR